MENQGGLKGNRYFELLRLCIRWHAVPVTYELGGVVKQGNHAQHTSWMTEIWKGVYDGETVALKGLRLSQDDPDTQMAKQVSMLYDPQREFYRHCADIW